MHKYEDYIDIVDGDEMKEDEIDCIVCGALEKLKAHDEDCLLYTSDAADEL